MIDGISEAFVIQFFHFMMAAPREAIYYEADDRTTQMPRVLQDRLADIVLLTGWKMVLAGLMRFDCPSSKMQQLQLG